MFRLQLHSFLKQQNKEKEPEVRFTHAIPYCFRSITNIKSGPNKSISRSCHQLSLSLLLLLLFQAVEQDRHLLRRKIASLESEYEARIVELQNDISELTTKLAAKEQTIRQWEREKSTLVTELNAQNTRLTSQLKEAANLEQHMRIEIQNLREECAVGKSSLQEHMSSVDSLRDELVLVQEKKDELERRLQMAAAERDNLATALEEASDRILLLERHAREQDVRYQQSLKEYSLPQEKLMSIEDKLNGEFILHSPHHSRQRAGLS